MIAIVDYGLGNLASVRNAFRAVGADPLVSFDPAVLREADGLVVPGVGAASAGMERLRARGLDRIVREMAESGRPLLGICLGMQLLFERSAEGDAECLGLISGTVERLRGAVKVPHIGWNQVDTRSSSPLWQGMDADPYLYFVHSYICAPANPEVVAGTTEYGGPFCSAIVSGTIWGTQFHPERSGGVGLRLIRNFVDLCRAEAKYR